jgi:hypothetical protein
MLASRRLPKSMCVANFESCSDLRCSYYIQKDKKDMGRGQGDRGQWL